VVKRGSKCGKVEVGVDQEFEVSDQRSRKVFKRLSKLK
jgi:hypothetical protein